MQYQDATCTGYFLYKNHPKTVLKITIIIYLQWLLWIRNSGESGLGGSVSGSPTRLPVSQWLRLESSHRLVYSQMWTLQESGAGSWRFLDIFFHLCVISSHDLSSPGFDLQTSWTSCVVSKGTGPQKEPDKSCITISNLVWGVMPYDCQRNLFNSKSPRLAHIKRVGLRPHLSTGWSYNYIFKELL